MVRKKEKLLGPTRVLPAELPAEKTGVLDWSAINSEIAFSLVSYIHDKDMEINSYLLLERCPKSPFKVCNDISNGFNTNGDLEKWSTLDDLGQRGRDKPESSLE